MTPDELLRRVTGVLERLRIPYLVTGSTACVFFGEPRFTNDIDVVLEVEAGDIPELCRAFPEDEFYLSEEAATAAVRRRGQFNLIHPRSGLKVDLIVSAGSAFDQSRFQRARRLQPGPNFSAWFASPEDVILKKLEFYQRGGSDKHLRDIGGILRVSGASLDYDYLDNWARELGLTAEWQEARARAERSHDRSA